MTATGIVLGVALALFVASLASSSLSARTRWLLLLLALAAGILAVLRLQGTL
jgi:F0F1-type ATP synthase assembly protein I